MDDRTIRFVFKEPFLDFAILFGTANVAAPGWVVPEKYYKQVGADGFKQKPIGAGPYKLVRHEPGVKVEMEAFDGYYRPVHVKQLVMVSVPEAATRVAMLERGEADIIYNVPGELIAKVGKLPGVTLAPVLSGSFFLEFPGFQDPKNPFRDKRVREAVSLALDRRAMNQAETAGLGKVTRQLDQRRRAVRDRVAGVRAQRREGQAAPARGRLSERLRRGLGHAAARVLLARRAHHRAAPRGRHPRPAADHGARHLLPEAAGRAQGVARASRSSCTAPASPAAGRSGTRRNFKCGGFNSRDRICVKDLDAKFDQYERSINPAERKKLAEEIQRGILENYYLVPVFRHAFVNAIGPRVVAQKWQDVFPTITTGYAYPWEDLKVKDQ